MKIRTLSILALAAIAAVGCKKGDSDSETTTADSAVVPGVDSAQVTVPVTVPDTIVKTTTTDVDTAHGNAPDTMHHDTTKKM
ncbi:MAG: hypothetical protein ACJ8J0_23090 [Longimicrobiaceae bacterium]